MFCSNCGSQIPDNSKFCTNCGNPISSDAVPVKSTSSTIDAKTTGILAYITWIGFLLALCLGDREGAKFHLNQALVLNLFALLSPIPIIGWAWGIFVFVCWLLAFIGACQGEEKETPLFGKIKILS